MGRLTPPLPHLSSLSLRLCSPTQLLFSHFSQVLLLFSLLRLSLFSAFFALVCPSVYCLRWSVHGSRRDDKQLKCCRVKRCVFSVLFLQSHFYLWISSSLGCLTSSPLDVCLSLLCFSVFSKTELWIFRRLPKKRKYLCISTFFSFPSTVKKKGVLEMGGACLPHVEASWTKTNLVVKWLAFWEELPL